jgi:dihydrofolate synthase/folylpolyglutamate synthase
MATLTSFEQAREYLHSFVDFERRGFRRHFADVVNLDTIRALLEALDNPQRRFPILHLAGTKGKGSTASLCEAALREAGYRTGLYTSPHLLSMCERIRLQGRPVSEDRLVELVRELRPAVEGLEGREDLNPPSFFELYTALAFLAFAEARVDIAVVETGLGGRLDATNVVTPLVTAITTIGRDHTEILGDTLALIAGEKAGILKAGVPVALAPQEPEAEAVVRARAAELGAPVLAAPAVCPQKFRRLSPPADGSVRRVRQNVLLQTGGGGLHVRLPLLGRYQQTNLAVAWTAVDALGAYGFPVTPEQFTRGVEGVHWPGRFEIVSTRPWVVLDCAHNPLSLEALAQALSESLRYRRLVLVFGMSADKEVPEAAAQIAPLADQVVLTQAMMYRALWASDLARATWSLWRAAPYVRWTVAEALAQARELADPEDCICVTGSIFVVAEALEALGKEVE